MGSNGAALARTAKTTTGASQLEQAQEGLPNEIKKKGYSCERELRTDLERLGADDLQIVLNGEGFAVWREMPGERCQAKLTGARLGRLLTFSMDGRTVA